jgi:hypothetical protein
VSRAGMDRRRGTRCGPPRCRKTARACGTAEGAGLRARS